MPSSVARGHEVVVAFAGEPHAQHADLPMAERDDVLGDLGRGRGVIGADAVDAFDAGLVDDHGRHGPLQYGR